MRTTTRQAKHNRKRNYDRNDVSLTIPTKCVICSKWFTRLDSGYENFCSQDCICEATSCLTVPDGREVSEQLVDKGGLLGEEQVHPLIRCQSCGTLVLLGVVDGYKKPKYCSYECECEGPIDWPEDEIEALKWRPPRWWHSEHRKKSSSWRYPDWYAHIQRKKKALHKA